MEQRRVHTSTINLEPEIPPAQKVLDRITALMPLVFLRIYARNWKKHRQVFWKHLFHDILAGLTIGAVVVPQAMSFATVAGLLPVYGLYNSFVSLLPYPLFGTSSHLVPGPTAVMSILVKRSIPGSVDGSIVSQELHQYLSFVLAFFAGLWQTCLGTFGLGFLADLVSEPVISGFTSAAAVLVITTQVPVLLGIPSCTRNDGNACTFIDAMQNVQTSQHIVTPAIPVSAILTILFLFAFKFLFQRRKATKMFSSFGPLIVILVAIPMAMTFDQNSDGSNNTCVLSGYPPCVGDYDLVMGQCCVASNPFANPSNASRQYTREVKVYDRRFHIRQVGPISPGLPSFLSPFRSCTSAIESLEIRTISVTKTNVSAGIDHLTCDREHVVVNDNGTIFSAVAATCSFQSPQNNSRLLNMTIQENTKLFSQQCVGFDTIKQIMYSSVMVAFIGCIESVTIAKVVARRVNPGSEASIKPSNELFAIGVSNMLCSFLQGYPITGSISRTAINGEAGAKSSLSLFVSSVIVVICLMFLTPTLAYLPKFALGAIVFEAVIRLIDPHKLIDLWRIDKRDFVVMLTTFLVVVLVGIEDGVVVGILLSWVMNLTHIHPPKIHIHNTISTPQPSPVLRRRSTVFGVHSKRALTRGSSSFDAAVAVDIASVQVFHDLDFAGCPKIRESVLQVFATYAPKYLLLDLRGAHNLDSTGVHVLDSIVKTAADLKVRHVCLAGVNDKLASRIKKSAKQKAEYQKHWEYETIHKSSNPNLFNKDAIMIMFDKPEHAMAFLEDQLFHASRVASPSESASVGDATVATDHLTPGPVGTIERLRELNAVNSFDAATGTLFAS